MTELALCSSGDVTTYSSDPTGGRLTAWASSLFAAKQIADALCETTFAPAHFRGKPADGAAAIMFGDEIGLTPTQALRSVYVISGTPALYARAMVALVLHHGHTVETVEKTDAKVTVRGRRKGSSHTIEETWTTARAQKAGYTNNKKYASDPQAMLYARAASDVCRQIAPDALAGLAYSVEEMELLEPVATTTVTRAPAAPRKVQRTLAPVPEEPSLDDAPVVPEPVADEPSVIPITAAQMKKLHAAMGVAGLTDREQGLAFLGAVIGRNIDTSKALSKDEATRVIDELERLNAAEAATDQGDEPDEPPLDGEALWPETARIGGGA